MSMVNRPKPQRRSIRLPGYDYSDDGAYFVTICTKNRECLFGEIRSGTVELSKAGQMVQDCWLEIPKHFENVQLDEFVILPNHLHGIIVIIANNNDFNRRGEVTSPGAGKTGGRIEETGGGTPPLKKPKPTLGKIMAYYKYQTTKLLNEFRRTPGLPVWQRNYYEHIIRSEKSLNKIRQYIMDNPLTWPLDIENPAIESNSRAPRGEKEFWNELV